MLFRSPSSNNTREDYTWTSPHGQHQYQIDYILCSQDGEALYSQQKQDRVLIVAQIIKSLLKNSLNLKKGKNTRQFTYVLNQISYDYTVEVTNRFKGLDLVDRVPEELWTEVCNIVKETVIKTIPKKKKCKMAV